MWRYHSDGGAVFRSQPASPDQLVDLISVSCSQSAAQCDAQHWTPALMELVQRGGADMDHFKLLL